MIRSMFAGVSALRAHQTMMDVVGNNIANVNTMGFKSSSVNFSDLFSQTIKGSAGPAQNRGGVNQQQIGLGARVATVLDAYTQGSLQVTGNTTDLAIQGDGFFIVNNGSQDMYTRAGNFAFDRDGNLVSPGNGNIVQGWVADANGAINTNATIGDLTIPLSTTVEPKTTTEATLEGNLDSRTWGTASYQTSITVYDALGAAHEMKVMFSSGSVNGERHTQAAPWAGGDTVTAYHTAGFGNLKVSNADTGVVYTNGVDYTATATGLTIVAGGNLTGTNAALKLDYSYTAPPVNQWDWVATVDGYNLNDLAYDGGSGRIAFTTAGIYDGLSSVITDPIDFTPANTTTVSINQVFDGMTQYAADGTAAATRQDGYTSGTVSGYTISDTGTINGIFTNGIQRNLGQVAVANFANPSALLKVGDSLIMPSNNSGVATVGAAGKGGFGSIVAGSLEMSNVDLAREFTNLIIAQRGFQANARVITTSDEVLTDLVGLKR